MLSSALRGHSGDWVPSFASYNSIGGWKRAEFSVCVNAGLFAKLWFPLYFLSIWSPSDLKTETKTIGADVKGTSNSAWFQIFSVVYAIVQAYIGGTGTRCSSNRYKGAGCCPFGEWRYSQQTVKSLHVCLAVCVKKGLIYGFAAIAMCTVCSFMLSINFLLFSCFSSSRLPIGTTLFF